MSSQDLVALLAVAVTAGTPILLAALGELLTERSGILNLGVEGMMLVGAAIGFVVAVTTGNSWLGFMVAGGAGGLMGLIHAVITVSLKGNQVVSGLALTIFGGGLSAFMAKSLVGNPVPNPFRAVALPGLADLPVLGPVLFNHDYLVYISYGIAIGLWVLIFRTPYGLRIRAVGENPAAADVAGLSVNRIRYFCTVGGGVLAGLGGAYLTLAYAPTWIENMTAGRGWIAVALVIFAMWNPLWAMFGSYLFGGVLALGFRLQIMGVQVSSFFLHMLPYIFTIVVMCLVIYMQRERNVAPGALGVPYYREER
ncbi:MAG: ABC transporter permease [Methylocystaceae bacterium]